MKKAVFLLPQIGFNDNELSDVKKILEKNKIKCVLASFSTGKAIGKFGKKININEIFANLKEKDYDVAIMVGGQNVSSLFEYEFIIKFLDDMLDKKTLALMCMNPALYISKSDRIKGKKMVAFRSKNNWSIENIKNNGGFIENTRVFRDGI
jgi:putative intracellular protease/amidase